MSGYSQQSITKAVLLDSNNTAIDPSNPLSITISGLPITVTATCTNTNYFHTIANGIDISGTGGNNVTTGVAIAGNYGLMLYKDSATGVFDNISYQGSMDDITYYQLGSTFPNVDGANRVANVTMDLTGLNYFRIRNDSATDISAVYCELNTRSIQ